MSRPRSAGRRDLPANLYIQKKGKRTYFMYRRPDTGRTKSLGTNRPEALRAARLLNNQLMSFPTAERLASRVLAAKNPLHDWIESFRDRVLPQRRNKRGVPLAQKTIREYAAQLKRVDSALGTKDVAQITRRDVAAFLEPLPPTMRNRMRGLLSDLFATAVAEGHRDDNPVAGTLKATEVVARQRLTKEEFDAIRTAADEWFRRALDLALITVQRREDLAHLTHDDVRDDCLHIVQQKTGARLRLALTGRLKEVIGSRGPVPEILWRPTEKGPRRLTVEVLSREFARLRDKVLPDDPRPAAAKPTFHEIRALGARLYKDRGADPQALLGHVDPQMTRTYLDRHEERWVEIEL